MANASRAWQITEGELTVVDQFRRSQRTSVLTIMFTDMKGFTQTTEQKGDDYSLKLRKLHDDLLTETIEEGGAGKIVKHIGDSVMAVFSEPATAVARSIRIQNKIQQLHQKEVEMKDIQVRIGLHMGQVTMDDKMSLDVFGRHVNRAARIEGLADGGQVLMTYTVFDSAQSWLVTQNKEEVSSVLHGRYFLKGIAEPVEIYEVYNPKYAKPRRPVDARRQRSWPQLAAAAVLVFLGVLGTLAVLYVQRPTVIFQNFGVQTEVFLDHSNEPLRIEGEPDKYERRSVTWIPMGKHLLHYDVSSVTRYYAPIEVGWGKNYLKPRFEYFGMPGKTQQVMYEKGGTNQFHFSDMFEYVIYNSKQQQQPVKTLVGYQIKVQPKDLKSSSLVWTFEYKFNVNGSLDGKEMPFRSFSVEHDSASQENLSGKELIYEDERHFYYLNYRLDRMYCTLDVVAEYIEYKKVRKL
jgi:class 3 adenylate cyclase